MIVKVVQYHPHIFINDFHVKRQFYLTASVIAKNQFHARYSPNACSNFQIFIRYRNRHIFYLQTAGFDCNVLLSRDGQKDSSVVIRARERAEDTNTRDLK